VFSVKKPSELFKNMQGLSDRNQLQSLKTSGNQPRSGILSPNVVTSAQVMTVPGHVSEVRAIAQKANDSTSKITVTYSRNPNDYQFVEARVYVSGYKGNPAPVQVASGQSPVSFALENTGEPVAVIVQSSGNLGQAPISTAPTTTLQLVKTNLATVPTAAGNGPYVYTPATPFQSVPAFWTCGMGGPFSYTAGNFGLYGTGTANQVKFWTIELPFDLLVNKLAVSIVGTQASGVLGFAVYSKDGQTKLISWDNLSGTSTAQASTTLSPGVLLPAGVYIMATSNSLAGNQASTGGSYLTRGSGNTGDPWNINQTRQGVGSNSMSGGVMPSSLGTLSTSSALQNNLPVISLET
jgi:hypothetical protein